MKLASNATPEVSSNDIPGEAFVNGQDSGQSNASEDCNTISNGGKNDDESVQEVAAFLDSGANTSIPVVDLTDESQEETPADNGERAQEDDADLQSFSAEDESKAACSDDDNNCDESGMLEHPIDNGGEQSMVEALVFASKEVVNEECD